ncbi:hypothetical protein LXL04_006502 [Taraxacum kok-saghyz]
MFKSGLPLFTFLLLFSTIAAQPYKATENFLLDCGSSASTPTSGGRRWDGDESSKFISPNSLITTSFPSQASTPDPSVNQPQYTTARIFNSSSFTYRFPVSEGPKFLRLFFYPTTYSDLNADQSFFSATSNGYSLLTNFSASMTASFLKEASFFKEFIIYVKDTQFLNVTFTPSPNSFAFINGIEIVSMPENLYFRGNNMKYAGITSGPGIDNYTALENLYRINVGGPQISDTQDTGMYRSWNGDDNYLFPINAVGFTPSIQTPITYSTDTPNYTAPELVYQTQRSIGNLSINNNKLTWLLPVDSGFYYVIRLHFCSIMQQYTFKGQAIFKIFINNQTAEKDADVFDWTPGSGYAVFKDYGVFVGDSVFKISMEGNLSSPNPESSSTTPPPPTSLTPAVNSNKKKTPYGLIAGGVAGGIVLLLILVLIILRQRRRVKDYGTTDDKSSWVPVDQSVSKSKSTKSVHSTLPSDRCRHFSLADLMAATDNFNENCVIGKGGFGRVYKGYMDNDVVAIKRLNSSSSQGTNEFNTEIGMLSKLRHFQLVSLIGYCDDDGEMILVYDYMAHGTLREHLYKTNNPQLPWKTRLNICIGAAKGLNYLHTGASRVIIHRDVKSTNILLDENWVAKVSDFGLSKLGPTEHQEQKHVSTMVKGSVGYVDPEYYRTQHLTDKSDVYSFGVVLLEVLCARPVMVPTFPPQQVNLAEWAKLCYRNKATLQHIVDPRVKSEIAPESLRKFEEVALSCLKEERSNRPTMEEVVWGLEFALQLQENATKTGGDVVSDNQEHVFLMQGGLTTDDDVFSGSSAIRNGTSSISSSFEGFKSETVFSEMQKKSGR